MHPPQGPRQMRHARQRRRRLSPAAVGIAGVAGVVGLVMLLATVGLPFGAGAKQQGDGKWSVKCNVTRTAADDPIVFPNQPGRSHLHLFYGNQTVTAGTILTNELVQGTSDCQKGMGEVDHASYWAPALLRNGNPIGGTPDDLRIDAYYSRNGLTGQVQPIPLGLRMLAGDSKATSPQPVDVVHYNCLKFPQGGQVTSSSVTMPSCPAGTYLSGRVDFANCWNGKDLDSADHKSHMAYAVNGHCDAAHPVPIPTVFMRIRWKSAVGVPSSQLSLSSGGQLTLHADFWNGWDPPVMKWLVDNCVNVTRECTDISRTQIPVQTSAFPNVNDQAVAATAMGAAMASASSGSGTASTGCAANLPKTQTQPQTQTQTQTQ
jgi:hypothetical protein